MGTVRVRSLPLRPNSLWPPTRTVTNRSPDGTAVGADGAASLEADALAVEDARRDADLDLAGAVDDPGAAAVLARRLDPHARALAVAARLAEREQALVLVAHAAAAARRADDGLVPGAAPVPPHVRAGGVAGDVDRRLDAVDRVLERQVELGLEVVALARARCPLVAGALRLAPRLKTPPRRSVMSSTRKPPGPPPAPAAAEAGERVAAAERVAHGPRRRTSSYSLRLASSPSTSYAALTSLNRSSSPPLVGMQLLGQLAVGLADLVLGRAGATPSTL